MTFRTDIVLPWLSVQFREVGARLESFQGVDLPMKTFALQAERHIWSLGTSGRRKAGFTGSELL